jgi:hypothetical protein
MIFTLIPSIYFLGELAFAVHNPMFQSLFPDAKDFFPASRAELDRRQGTVQDHTPDR